MILVGLELRVHGHATAADEVLNQAVAWYERRAASIAPEELEPAEIFNHSSLSTT